MNFLTKIEALEEPRSEDYKKNLQKEYKKIRVEIEEAVIAILKKHKATLQLNRGPNVVDLGRAATLSKDNIDELVDHVFPK